MSQLLDLAQSPLTYLTDPSLKIGGELKSIPEDFEVEEIPLYLPSGEGEHIYLWIEKRDISAEFLQQHLARQLGIRREEIGMAGLKDRRAITRQWVSVPGSCEPKVDTLDTELIRVLKIGRHTNKLKTGHLLGNRFRMIVRDVCENALTIAATIRTELLQRGIPNYFGAQRFGIDGETLQTGQQLLDGSLKPEAIPYQRRKFLTRLSLSAVQSVLFNVILSDRLQSQTAHTVQQGDVLQVVTSGGPFVSAEPHIDQLRFDAREVVTTGPLFGPKMKMPTEQALDYELGFLKSVDLTLDTFSRYKKLTSGARRPLLLWLAELQVSQAEHGLQFEFSLPTGTYATIVLREFIKAE